MPRAHLAKAAQKKPRSVDVAMGHLIRVHRLKMGISQTELAGALGVTFQQVQKYEKGVNRVGASRIVQIAAKLEIPVMALFPAGTHGVEPPSADADATAAANVADMAILTSKDGQRLSYAFERLPIGARKHLVGVAEYAARITNEEEA